jgi:glycosyltransferase involved in cell wall biosynthesis
VKVLQIGTSLYDWGGIERYVAYLAEGLIARGHDVHVACPPGSPLAQRTTGTILPARLKLQYSLWLVPSFARLFRKGGFDVAHVHFSPDFVVPVIAARMAKIQRIVLTRHVALPWSPAKVKRYAGRVDRVVCVSDAVRRVLGDSGVPAEQLVVAKAGCPSLSPGPGLSEMRSKFAKNETQFAIGFFGRLVPDKGIQHLCAAAESLPPNIAVHIFGEGPLSAELNSKHPRVHVHGFIPDVADAMAAMDAIVVPSVWAEAFPFSVLEAMSLAKPVIATRRGGLPEMVVDGKTGSLVEAENPAALANAIKALAADPAHSAAMGARAQEIQRRDYTIDAFARRMEDVYESIKSP